MTGAGHGMDGMSGIVYLNGRLVPAEKAVVSVFDRGFLYGDSVFETVRAYGPRLFALDDHFTRLLASARGVGIQLPVDRVDFGDILTRVLKANRPADAGKTAGEADGDMLIRLTVSRGIGAKPAPDPSGCERPTVVAFCRPLRPDPAAWERGIHALVSPIVARPEAVLSPTIKCGNFLPHILALAHARGAGADEAILLNARGRVAEGAVSNLFGVWRGALATPDAASGILPGVTRKKVLWLAREAGLSYQQRPIERAELATADELFMSNSGWQIMPVTTLDGRPVGDGTPGPVTRQLAEGFREMIAMRLGV